MANIILAHGILGFGRLPFGVESKYFNGIAQLYRDQLHEVLVPTVDLLGSLELRSKQLSRTINTEWPHRKDLIVIAHSMGGLDIRRMVSCNPAIAARVKTIVTIATPHLGSPVADAVLDSSNPLRPHIPGWLLSLLGEHAGAIEDLQTRTDLHDPDVANIRYLEIGCDASDQPASPLFGLTQAIGHLGSEGNDGVVTLASAKVPHRPLYEIWRADHLGAIGWPTGNLLFDASLAFFNPPPAHIDRYQRLLVNVLQ